jgi:hypothetical protein
MTAFSTVIFRLAMVMPVAVMLAACRPVERSFLFASERISAS